MSQTPILSSPALAASAGERPKTDRPGRPCRLTAVLVLGLLSASLAAGAQGMPASQRSKPNIIVVMADDLGWHDLGCYGQTRILTPQIDSLAARGMRFTDFYGGNTTCAPSRASFLTGLDAGHAPIRGNRELQPEGQWPMPASDHTLAELLRKAGYSTACFGKWGLGPIGSAGDPLRQGFELFYGYNCQRQAHNYYPDHLYCNDLLEPVPNSPLKQTEYGPELIQQQIRRYIYEHRARPFFLYLAYTLPHPSLQVPDDALLEHYKKLLGEKPRPLPAVWERILQARQAARASGEPLQLDGAASLFLEQLNNQGLYYPQPYPNSAYADMVSRFDAYVGELARQLRRLGLDKNTLLIVTGDHGPNLEGGSNHTAFFHSAGNLRGLKRDLYEGGIRIPFIAVWPGHIAPGSVSEAPFINYDLLPTFAALARFRGPLPPHDGVSILPTLLGRGPQPQLPYMYWEFNEGNGAKQALRKGNWKLVCLNVDKARPDAPQLFNLKTDPDETTDVAAAHPDIVHAMLVLIRREHRPNPDFPLLHAEQPSSR